MALVSTTAFILKLDPISEKDMVAALLTRDHGVVRAAVKGARGRTRRAAALQLLTEVEATYFRKEGADLARLDEVEVVKSAFDLASRPETAMLLPYLAESALTFVPESELGGEMYRLVRHLLDALEAGVDAELAARYFEVWLLRLAGLMPEETSCAGCGAPLPPGDVRLDPTIPGFLGSECAERGALTVPAASRALLAAIRRGKLTALKGPYGRHALEGVEVLAREVRRRFLGHELRSYPLLRALS